jgi:hypothetical protein
MGLFLCGLACGAGAVGLVITIVLWIAIGSINDQDG